MPEKRQCGTCRFLKKASNLPDTAERECFRNPPRDKLSFGSVWPMKLLTDSCRDYQAREHDKSYA